MSEKIRVEIKSKSLWAVKNLQDAINDHCSAKHTFTKLSDEVEGTKIKLKKFKVTLLLNGMDRNLYGLGSKYNVKRVSEEVSFYLDKMEDGTDIGVVKMVVKELK